MNQTVTTDTREISSLEKHEFTNTKKAPVTFLPGEGIFSVISGSTTPPPGSGTNIRYAGFTTSSSVDTSEPYTGNYLLTYNSNTNKTGTYEKGFLAGVQAAGTQSLSRAAAFSMEQSSLPENYPIGFHDAQNNAARNNPDGYPAKKVKP